MIDAVQRSTTTLHVLGALAIERDVSQPATCNAVSQAQAGGLAALMARDLCKFVAEAAALDLFTVGAHYDPVELLRPGWALHRELDELSARAPKAGVDGARVIAFGTFDALLPGALMPSTEHGDGPMRLVPFVLGGDADVVARVGDAFERELLERGMAAADTALLAQELFGLKVEHARYLTAHDLAAMTAMQYEHAGLAALWPLLETALLDPDATAVLDTPPEPHVTYAGREASIALYSPDGWRARYVDEARDAAWLERHFEAFQMRQRQFAAVFEAHGVPVVFAQA